MGPDDVSELEKIIAELGKDVRPIESGWFQALKQTKSRTESMEDRENSGILQMRNWWSFTVLGLIVLIVVFDMILVWFYGSQRWVFDNPTVVVVVITDNFLKIFGLGYLMSKEIFRKIFH